MKGVIFTEFLEMLEQRYGIDFIDEIVEDSDLASGGAFTAVGNYDHSELRKIVSKTAERTGESIAELLVGFGRYLFGTFMVQHRDMIGEVEGTIDLLERVENFIHPDVKKLYPEARPPGFTVEHRTADSMVLVYSSRRSLSEVAKGLMQGAMEHFGESFQIDIESLDDDGTRARFTLRRVPE